jgi:hypothetical protein
MLYPDELRAHFCIGRGGEIRTPDILLPKQARYQTALHPATTRLKDRDAIIQRIFVSVNMLFSFFLIFLNLCFFLSYYSPYRPCISLSIYVIVAPMAEWAFCKHLDFLAK